MTPADLNPKLAVQVRLALFPTEATVAEEAAKAGLTGAEIDAAREGRSFDIQAQAAIVLALALRGGVAMDAVRGRAERVGLCAGQVRALLTLARED